MGEDYGKLQRKLQDWIAEEKRNFKLNINSDSFFELIIEWDKVQRIVLGAYRDNPHKIIVRMPWTMNAEHIARLDSMPKDQRESIFWNMRFALAQREDSFYMGDYHNKGIWLSAQRMVYIEDLTRTRFFEALRELSMTFRTLGMIYGASLGLPKDMFTKEDEHTQNVYG